MPKFIDRTGQIFNNLTVVEFIEQRNRVNYWLVECNLCGFQKPMNFYAIQVGKMRKCYCKEKKVRKNQKTGESRSKLYGVWRGMVQRCTEPLHAAYNRYGGRGIHVCEEWLDYNNFKVWANKNNYNEGLCLDRLNNELGYSPDNCKFVSYEENNRNRRSSVKETLYGGTKTLIEWVEDCRCECSYNALKKEEVAVGSLKER